MTPIQFLVVHSWYFVGLALLSVVCFNFRFSLKEKGSSSLWSYEYHGNDRGMFISYSRPFKRVWYLASFGFWTLLYLIAKLPFVLTFVGLALVSMFGK